MAHNLSSTFRPSHRMLVGLLLIASLSLVAGVFLLRRPTHSLRIRACFQDVNGLRAGAFVRIAGVEVGRVRTIHAQPTNSTCPANVEMELATDYPLSLPNDAVASINTAGILGAPNVSIDASGASGPPVAIGGQIRSQENAPFTAAGLERILDKFAKDLKDMKDKADEQKNAPCPGKPEGTRNSTAKPRSN